MQSNHPLLCAALLAALPGAANAQATQATVVLSPGTYRCSSYNVSGGGGSCRTMPPLILHPDGRYEFSSTRGSWSVQQGELVLSETKLWGPGTILGRDLVRFEYRYRGWDHVVTWRCQACAEAPPTAGEAQAGGGTPVGVSLTLEFDTGLGGVSGFVIVPAEAARRYTHNAPLPPGAVQGLAWETSRTSVALATSRDNRLVSGRRYVVFLSWPRATIPVAILALPPVTDDFTAALPATLDGASVLAQLARQGERPAPRIEPRTPSAEGEPLDPDEFETSGLPDPPQTLRQQQLWELLRHARTAAEKAAAHGKLAEYYEELARKERRRAEYWRAQR